MADVVVSNPAPPVPPAGPMLNDRGHLRTEWLAFFEALFRWAVNATNPINQSAILDVVFQALAGRAVATEARLPAIETLAILGAAHGARTASLESRIAGLEAALATALTVRGDLAALRSRVAGLESFTAAVALG